MTALDSLRQGNLAEALSKVQDSVKSDPSCSKHRVFLFQLLLVNGDWKRALTQLGVLHDMDASTLPMVQTYREAIQCEALRREVFAGARSPLVVGEPEQWVALLIEALRRSADGNVEHAQSLRSEAFDKAPTSSGRLWTKSAEGEGTTFEWLADADSRVGPVLEVIVNGKYYWAPFERITRIDIETPTDLRDCVWMPAHFEWRSGGETVGLIPTRYVGSESSDDPKIRLARMTTWTDQGGTSVGLGQRILATDREEHSLMDVRRIVFDAPVS